MPKITAILITAILAAADTLPEIDWGAAEDAVRKEREAAAACRTMRTDTMPIIPRDWKKKQSISHVFIFDTRDIDSVQVKEDSLASRLYSDKQFKKMARFNVSDRIGFFNHLLHYKIKDSTQVHGACMMYLEILNYQYQKLQLILDSQNDDTRASIYLHIRKNRNEAQVVGGYLYSISPME